MDNNITIQNTISIGIEIPPETFINEKTINVQNLIIESSSTNNGTICIPDNVSNNIVVPSKKKKIFIVHGHDNEVKLEVARFIEKIGLEPIILHEQVANYVQTECQFRYCGTAIPFLTVRSTAR